ncbi:ParM/StbA family protein [Leptolyngbya sp. NIES-2104]|uniref:ParM/StbA family protein n=1 Tax=Leptolyngbya sp. NIES-2104 TaxID=1552121 RepID=UPI0006EC78A2|nr:hypothetical protein [Leptolyngbya sp. NIES-2104]GAQ00187.1 actin-like ATPase [Leptolyngbya sp. NIES-2104]
MVLSSPKLATLASDNQFLPVGTDCGNGNLKLIVDHAEIRTPSYFLPIHGEPYDIPAPIDGGFVQYLEGTRSDLVNQTWITGKPAYTQDPLACLRIVDDERGKIRYGLQMLLGGIATLSHRPLWRLLVVASIQDAKVFGSELKLAIAGTHTVKFNGKHHTTVEIQVASVMEEGSGAILSNRAQIDADGQNILIDFGSGTTILSLFGAKGKLIDRRVYPAGVERLIDAIATNQETRKRLAQEGDRAVIRTGIENSTFSYGRIDWNFRDIYNQELKPWVQSVLAPALKIASPWVPTASTKLAIGGGSQLPGIAQLLARQEFVVVPDGAWSNARGLARIAQLQRVNP